MRQVALVTGGASGIGLATAHRLIGAGWAVAVLDRDGQALSAFEDVVNSDDAIALECDVTNQDDVGDVLDAVIERFGLIAGVVNAAGIARDMPVEETSVEDFRHILDVNCVGSFLIARGAMARMAGSLAIVNIASVSGLRANRGRLAYGASKAAVKMMTEIMALELAETGIRVNCVCPGPIDTPLVQQLHSSSQRHVWLERTPLGRYGTPDEVADAILFLLSEKASYITGQTLAVDGGFSTAGIIQDV